MRHDMSEIEKLKPDDAWILKMAADEEGSSIEVGGMYGRLKLRDFDGSRRSLAQFVQLSRRQLGLSSHDLAAKAQVALADVLAIETGGRIVGGAEPVIRLAGILGVPSEPLLVLAGLKPAPDEELEEAAAQFTARLEPVTPLEPREKEALDWFKSEALRPSRQTVGSG
jgi:transcriptional regulator with XRE-family HTH domain